MTGTLPRRRLRAVRATRYVTAFREGGSLPGLVEADDDGLYVVKFRGAGQGPRALVAEWLAGEIGRALGLLVPDIVTVDLDAGIADAEPHEEIHDLLVASVGRNLGLDFLPGSLTFNPAADHVSDPDWAADVVWFDAFVTNPDRSAKNPNLLVWHGRTWLIDHGAALYVHHTWRDPDEHARRPFERTSEHVLLPVASSIAAADERLAPRIDETLLAELVAEIPDEWLADGGVARHDDAHVVNGADAQRRAYVTYLLTRLEARRAFVEEADRARSCA
ncbi:MAG TPA: HipA family kinase [Candidatus Limnocylindrales bacterium]|nr:HipA family kinase [Candidatus Limnocylindrales bacterium]